MKYIFYSIALIVAFFMVALFVPTASNEKDEMCAAMYKNYKEEIEQKLPHAIGLEYIEDTCKDLL